MFEQFYSLEVRALSWNSSKGRGEADGMERRLAFTSCFIPVIWFGRKGDKSVFLAFPQLKIFARGHSLEVAWTAWFISARSRTSKWRDHVTLNGPESATRRAAGVTSAACDACNEPIMRIGAKSFRPCSLVRDDAAGVAC